MEEEKKEEKAEEEKTEEQEKKEEEEEEEEEERSKSRSKCRSTRTEGRRRGRRRITIRAKRCLLIGGDIMLFIRRLVLEWGVWQMEAKCVVSIINIT